MRETVAHSERGCPSPPAGEGGPKGRMRGNRAKRDGSDRAIRSASLGAPQHISKVSGIPQSHLAPLDYPLHPSLLPNDTPRITLLRVSLPPPRGRGGLGIVS